jgi:hypothetical protein
VTPSPRGSRNKQYCAQHRQYESHKQRAVTHSSPEPTAASSSLAVLFSPLSLSPADVEPDWLARALRHNELADFVVR